MAVLVRQHVSVDHFGNVAEGPHIVSRMLGVTTSDNVPTVTK